MNANSRARNFYQHGPILVRPAPFGYLRSSRWSQYSHRSHGRCETGHRETISARLEAARSGDPSRLIADASKAGRVLGWSPTKADLQFIVRSAWDWHLRHPQGYASK